MRKLALRPDTGELVWYFQTTPGDNLDFTVVQPDGAGGLTIDGREHKLM